MAKLAGFWHAAARLDGRIDLSAAARAAGGALADWPAERLAAHGLSPGQAAALRAGAALECPGPWLTLVDAGYPAPLFETPFPPAVLFLRGDSSLLSLPGVAIVGTRRCTDTGLRIARGLARSVAEAGGVVVSGLAYGIDSAAHGAALSRTVAVLGQGLGSALTPGQRRLADAILDAGGLLVSALPPEQAACRWTFPPRNRIIAGLARATVVVEAAERSGALITARYALEAGREVLAVPGSPLSEASAGCLTLLGQGARICRGAVDLLETAGLSVAPPADPLGLWQALARPVSLDALVERTGAPTAALAAALSALELTGRVQRLPGDRYARIEQKPPGAP